MKYYLKKTETTFYSAQGDMETGGIEKEVGTEFDYPGVTVDGIYIDQMGYDIYLDNKDYCREYSSDIKYFSAPLDWEEVVSPQSEDGDHCSYSFYKFKEIIQEEFLNYLEIIGKYNQI